MLFGSYRIAGVAMYLKHKQSGDLVEILDTRVLFDPSRPEVAGRYHAGEELQERESFEKSALIFPSGEELPRCWMDASYKHQVSSKK